MKQLLTFFLFLWSLCSVQAQYRPFPTDSALWSYASIDVGSFYRTNAYKLKGDTTIYTVTYSKLYTIKNYSYDTDSGAVLHALLRINNTQSKVWLKYVDYNLFRDTTEFLLYDFSLQLNDTFYARRIVTDSVTIETDTLIAESKFSIQTLNDSLRVILLRRLGNTDYYSFVDKIGSNQFLLYPESELAGFPNSRQSIQQSISCFKQGDAIFYQSNPCILNLLMSDKSVSRSNHLHRIYPTVFKSGEPIKFNLKNEQSLPVEHVTIFNAAGLQMENITVLNDQEVILTQKHYVQGLYLVNVMYRNGHHEYFKIIVN